jgi:hypothetical protein
MFNCCVCSEIPIHIKKVTITFKLPNCENVSYTNNAKEMKWTA